MAEAARAGSANGVGTGMPSCGPALLTLLRSLGLRARPRTPLTTAATARGPRSPPTTTRTRTTRKPRYRRFQKMADARKFQPFFSLSVSLSLNRARDQEANHPTPAAMGKDYYSVLKAQRVSPSGVAAVPDAHRAFRRPQSSSAWIAPARRRTSRRPTARTP